MWWEGLIGGAILGISVNGMLHATGRLTGISGFVNGLVLLEHKNFPWKAAWVLGLLVAASAFAQLDGQRWFGPGEGFREATWFTYLLGGFLVGFGTRVGNGCTSGHGICGLARASPRSIVATLTFVSSGFLSATIMNYHRPEFLLLPPGTSPLIPNEVNHTVSTAFLAVGALLLLVAVAYAWIARSRQAALDTLVTGMSGLIFGVGLAIGGMANRSKILAFLFAGPEWDIQLAFVLMGSILVAIPGIIYALAKLSADGEPWINDAFAIPMSRVITSRLVIGSWIFGVGWGITGLCPGPALMQTAAGFGSVAVWYIPAMAVGMAAVVWLDRFQDYLQTKHADETDKELEAEPMARLEAARDILLAAAHLAADAEHHHVTHENPAPRAKPAPARRAHPAATTPAKASAAHDAHTKVPHSRMHRHISPEDVGMTLTQLLESVLLHSSVDGGGRYLAAMGGGRGADEDAAVDDEAETLLARGDGGDGDDDDDDVLTAAEQVLRAHPDHYAPLDSGDSSEPSAVRHRGAHRAGEHGGGAGSAHHFGERVTATWAGPNHSSGDY